jgi:hypothetical protein
VTAAGIANPLLDGKLVFGIGRGALSSLEQTVAPQTPAARGEQGAPGAAPRYHPQHPLFWFAAFSAAGLGLLAYSTERASVGAYASAGGASAAADLDIGGK